MNNLKEYYKVRLSKLLRPLLSAKEVCKDCGCGLKNKSWVKTYRKWRKPVIRCKTCHDQRFINSIESSPMLLNNYYNIYGKKPSDIIGIHR